MLAMGASRPWPDALAAVSGERKADASAMLEYFEPLSRVARRPDQGRGLRLVKGPRGFRLALACAALLVAGGLVVIWAPPVSPGLDTPLNLVSAWISAHPSRYQGWFVPNWPLAVLTHRALLGAAFLVSPPFVALKLARTVELLVMATGCLALARQRGAAGVVAVSLGVAACFGWFHLMGYLNFTFAVALVPWALARLGEKPSRGDVLGMVLLLLLITESHTFVGAAFASILVAAALCHRGFDHPEDHGPSRVALFGAAPVFVLMGLTVVLAVPAQPEFETQSRRATTLAMDLAALPDTVFGGYSPLGAPLAALAVIVAATWLWSDRGARTVRWWVGLFSLASFALYFVVPLDAFGWLFLKPRLTPFPFLVAALPARLPPRLGKGMGALAVLLAGAHLAFYGVRSTRAGRRTAETIASFGHEAPGVMLPVVFDGHDGQEPAGNLGTLTYDYAYALLDGGGAATMLFAHNPALHHVLFAEGVAARIPRHPNPWAYRWLSPEELADQAAMTSCYADSVVVIGATDADRARLSRHGILFSSPGFGRPSCASGTLRVTRGKAPIRVRVGFAETGTWAVDSVLAEPSASLQVRLPPGEHDLLVCAANAETCLPGAGALSRQRLTLAPGETFQETLAGP